jgi:colanic acid biosynthesis glycosyl transferase WcaI
METPLRGRDLRRFRRFHRLVGPILLYAGPYTPAGGLESVLDAAFEVRKAVPETRFAAIPVGHVEQRYLDAMERRALALGHHGIIEWQVNDSERSFWYACATVVCAPSRGLVSDEPLLLAAAAGRPFVATEATAAAAGLRNNEGGYVLPDDDAGTLEAAVAALMGDTDEASRLGSDGRRWAERHLSGEAAHSELAALWHRLNPSASKHGPRSIAPDVELASVETAPG